MIILLLIRKPTSRLIFFLLSSCSVINFEKEKISNILSWSDDSNNLEIKDSILFECSENKTFNLRYIDEGEAVWIILKDREFRLKKDSLDNNKFLNGLSILNISKENTTLTTNKKNIFKQCKN